MYCDRLKALSNRFLLWINKSFYLVQGQQIFNFFFVEMFFTLKVT